MTAKEGVSQRSKYKKTEHSEIKQVRNNNSSVPKSKSILNKFEKGEVHTCQLSEIFMGETARESMFLTHFFDD